ncbi:hypothetical protein BDZ94DRAFT_1255346, partial [Collybia nuda]
MSAQERRGYNPAGSYRHDQGQNEGGMEVVRVGGHFPSSSDSHGQQYPLPTPTTAARASSLNRSDMYDYRNTARTFVGGDSGWENYDSPRMGKGSRGLTAQMPPLSVYSSSSCGTWRRKSPYGDDHRDRNATRLGQHLEKDMVYGLGPANMHSRWPERQWRRGEYGSHGHVPASGYTGNGSAVFSDDDSGDPGSGSDSESRYSSRGYVESCYFDSDYGEKTETYSSDSETESYDSRYLEGGYDDKWSEGIYSGSEAGSDSEYWISDNDEL